MRYTIKKIRPGTLGGMHDFAHIADESRDWLTTPDAGELKRLLSQWPSSGLPEPLRRAMWNCDVATYWDEMDMRWTLIATAIEALVHTDRHNSTGQFAERVPLLAREVGAGDITKEEAREMYNLRSSIAHGQGINDNDAAFAELKALYIKMERLLRLTLRHAILDHPFAQFLADRDRVKQQWPV